MPLLRCALGPTGRPCGDGLHYATASGTGGRKAAITRIWDMAGSTLKKPIRGRRMGVGAHLDPALRARLVSALQRPDLKPTTRAKIEAVLNNQKLNADE